MKRTLAIFALLIAGTLSICHAGTPVNIIPGQPESRYDYTNGTVSISSFTISTFTATSNAGYRELSLNSPTSFYFRLDGVSTTMQTTGFPCAANTTCALESNQVIYLQLGSGLSTVTGKYLEKKK